MTSHPNITGYRYAKREKTKQLFAEMEAAKKGNKYGAKKTEVDGIVFDSKREAVLYHEFKLLLRAGKLSNLKRQPSYDLIVNGHKIKTYRADFEYLENGTLHVIDVKSEATAKTRDFIMTRKLMRAIHNIEIEVLL